MCNAIECLTQIRNFEQQIKKKKFLKLVVFLFNFVKSSENKKTHNKRLKQSISELLKYSTSSCRTFEDFSDFLFFIYSDKIAVSNKNSQNNMSLAELIEIKDSEIQKEDPDESLLITLYFKQIYSCIIKANNNPIVLKNCLGCFQYVLSFNKPFIIKRFSLDRQLFDYVLYLIEDFPDSSVKIQGLDVLCKIFEFLILESQTNSQIHIKKYS